MYKSTILLSCAALTPHAIKLGSHTHHEEETDWQALTEHMYDPNIPRDEQPDHAAIAESLSKQTVENMTMPGESQTSGDSGCGCHQGCAPSCGCGCHNEDHINLPSDVYLNPQVESIAEGMVDALDPEVIDLTLDLGLSAEEIANMEHDVLLAAFEKAIQGMIDAHP